MADRDIPEEMVEKAARELREQYDSEHDAIAPSEMPPVPCPDCMHPTEHDGDLFHCTDCGQAFSTPNGMDLSMWQELWRAWTAGRQVVDLPAEPAEQQWQVTVSVPMRLDVENRQALFATVAAAVAAWEPDDRDGWDADVYGCPAPVAAGSGSGED